MFLREEELVKNALLEKVSISKEGEINFDLLLSLDLRVFESNE